MKSGDSAPARGVPGPCDWGDSLQIQEISMMRYKSAISALALCAAMTPIVPVQAQSEGTTSEMTTGETAVTITANDPILAEWGGPYGGVPPWDEISQSDFIAASDLAFAAATAELDAIANNPEPATFENTIAAMERSGAMLTRFGTLFSVHAGNLNVDEMPNILRNISPKFAAFSDSIYQNKALFQRISAVHDGKEMKKLSGPQKRLVDDNYDQFARRGANLNAEDKEKLSQINQRLASLTNDFSQHVLNDEEKYVTWIDNAADLAGLPDSIVDAMKAAASERDEPDKWAITNTRSSMDPFLTYADNRGLRESVWRTYYNRGDNGDENDNNAIITEILNLRADRAHLLGYETHAHWILQDKMAKTPENAMALMMKVWPKAVARANEEVADMQALADAEGANIKIAPWDYRYYADKVRKAKYDLDFDLVKPYMQLEKLREAMFWAAGQLYGFQFEQIDDVPVFHPDVRTWKVTNKKGKLVGLWYFDPYARAGKSSGAWMSEYRTQEKLRGHITPIVSNNANFVKGAEGEPVLISWDDAETLFHEFGHAIHGLNSDVVYPSQAGTNVPSDYVEFPSQLNEHWLSTPEVLSQFALHYETGEPIPQELVEKIEKASKFNQGFETVEYLAAALVDMKVHLSTQRDIDPDVFERETLDALGMPDEIVMRHRMPQFGHIFAGDFYSAGYYSYLWADALTADAAEAFEEAGSFYDKKTARKLHDNIMSVGNTIDPAVGFRKFRGRDVDTSALLRKRGFPVD